MHIPSLWGYHTPGHTEGKLNLTSQGKVLQRAHGGGCDLGLVDSGYIEQVH